ncbi:MAG: glycosyltransferase [Gemmataceae bacterium]|nr:glycosyltransferase [Gemmataceae bacterium]
MTNELPAVSVLMPVYNTEKYLAEAVDSILGQSFGDLELVAVDDGSTDGSGAMLDRYAAADPRVRVVHRPNGGYVTALVEGAALCRAPLIARLDSDDVALPGRLAAQVAHLAAHPDCVLVGGQVIFVDPDGAELARKQWPTDHAEMDWWMRFSRGVSVTHSTAVFRKAAYEAAGGYRPAADLVDDLDLWLRLAEVGRVANVPDYVVRYRVHPASVSQRRADAQERARWRVVREVAVRRGLRPAEVPFGEFNDDQRAGWIRVAVELGWYWTARRWAAGELARRPSVESAKQFGRAALGPLLRHALPAYDRLLGRATVRTVGSARGTT